MPEESSHHRNPGALQLPSKMATGKESLSRSYSMRTTLETSEDIVFHFHESSFLSSSVRSSQETDGMLKGEEGTESIERTIYIGIGQAKGN